MFYAMLLFVWYLIMKFPWSSPNFVCIMVALESQFFCWDYHKPKLSIGEIIQDKEVEYAKSLGLDYLYIG